MGRERMGGEGKNIKVLMIAALYNCYEIGTYRVLYFIV